MIYLSKRQFFAVMLKLGVAFGIIHGLQAIIVGAYAYHATHVALSAIYVLTAFEIIQGFVFVVIASSIMYVLLPVLIRLVLRPSTLSVGMCVVIGSVVGFVFVPLCAAVSFYVFPLEDAPTYWSRCKEFVIPLTLTGSLGGYLVWKKIRSNPLLHVRDVFD
jgi:hypothetical protein